MYKYSADPYNETCMYIFATYLYAYIYVIIAEVLQHTLIIYLAPAEELFLFTHGDYRY